MTDNSPDLWLSALPRPAPDGSKYDRGHAVVLGGPMASTGASRLAARAALRIGAGLVSVACDPSSLMVYAVALEAVMTKVVRDADAFSDLVSDSRITAVLLGPAAGVNDRTHAFVLAALTAGKVCVLDADALTVFQDAPEALFAAIRAPVLMTPHAGEFARLFGKVSDREADAWRAARQSGAVVLLKGKDTVIAAPDGRVVVNRDAPPWLATAGSGDELGGLATGLIAQGMPVFDAACAAAWIHAECARHVGPGLIAEDLSEQVPQVLRSLPD
ncbi:MAG: NAD(P)H-hydrate dehydratase [Asticcacaulis sp.]|nr:NAD(P)H-hydrate dehydratase [Asticcacaulis sp.]